MNKQVEQIKAEIKSPINQLNVEKDNSNYPFTDIAIAAINAADEDMQRRQIMGDSNENRQLYSRIFRRGFKAGAKWQKEQMLKDAVDAEAEFDYYDHQDRLYVSILATDVLAKKYSLKDRDKVKIIIIKKEEI